MNPNPIPTQIYTIPTPNPIPLHMIPNPESNPDSDSDSSFDSDSGFGIAPGLVSGQTIKPFAKRLWSDVCDAGLDGPILIRFSVSYPIRRIGDALRTCLPKSGKRFERSNGLDTAL